MLTTKQAEQLIHAKENIKEVKKILLPYYIEEYGEKYQDLIKDQLEHILFSVDSLPEFTFDALKEFPHAFDNIRDYHAMEKEYFDYQKKNRKLEQQKQQKINELYREYYQLSKYELRKMDMEDLFVDSFSSETKELLENKNIEQVSKHTIKDYREQYIRQCQRLGRDLSPIQIRSILF